MNLKKFIATIVLCCFTFSFILSDTLHAVLELKEEGAAAKQFSQIPANSVIPQSCGRITDGASFGGRQIIVNIQDLHCHPEIQRNIAKILAALDKEYGLKNVYVEGGYGDIDTSWLCNFGDKTLKKEILENLVDQGELTGSEYFSVLANRPDALKGLEDEALHKANIVRLGKILDRQEFFKSRIKDLDKDLAFMKARYFSSRSRRFNDVVARYAAGKIETGKYYRLLAQYARDIDRRPGRYNTVLPISGEDYPNIIAFLELQERARHIRYRQLSRQLQLCLQSLKSRLPYSEYNLLITRTGNFSDTDELCRLLAEIARSRHFDIATTYPDLQNFIEYAGKNRALNPLRLLVEEKRLVREIRLGLSENTAELEVSFLTDFYGYFQDYLLNRLTADDYEYFTAKFDKFRSVWGKYAFRNRIDDLSADFPLLSEFYAANNERNYCFLKNLGITGDGANLPASVVTPAGNTGASAIDLLGKAELVVVVTGGFHTAGLQKLLKEKRISWLSITPNVTQDTRFSSEVYTKFAKLQAKIFSNALALGLASQLSSPELFKLAIAAANRELKKAGITAQQRKALLKKLAKAAGLEIVSDEKGIVTFSNGTQISLKEIDGILKAEAVKGAPAGQAVKEAVDKALREALASLKGVKSLNDAVDKALIGQPGDLVELLAVFAAKHDLLKNNALIYEINQDPALANRDEINKIPVELLARFPGYLQWDEAQQEKLQERKDWLQILLAVDLLRKPVIAAVNRISTANRGQQGDVEQSGEERDITHADADVLTGNNTYGLLDPLAKLFGLGKEETGEGWQNEADNLNLLQKIVRIFMLGTARLVLAPLYEVPAFLKIIGQMLITRTFSWNGIAKLPAFQKFINIHEQQTSIQIKGTKALIYATLIGFLIGIAVALSPVAPTLLIAKVPFIFAHPVAGLLASLIAGLGTNIACHFAYNATIGILRLFGLIKNNIYLAGDNDESFRAKLDKLFQNVYKDITYIPYRDIAGEYYYTKNRDEFVKAIGSMIIPSGSERNNAGILIVGKRSSGEDEFKTLLVRDYQNNRFIVVTKNGNVVAVALQVKSTHPRKMRYEFSMVEDETLKTIFQNKIDEYKGKELFLVNDENNRDAQFMGGLLTDDEISDAKKQITDDYLLRYLFNLISEKYDNVILRGRIIVEIPEPHGGFYSTRTKEIFKHLNDPFNAGLYAHELTHHFFSTIRGANTGIYNKILAHFNEQVHWKLFEGLRNNKLYASGVKNDYEYLVNESLAYIVEAVYSRTAVDLNSGYRLTFGDIRLLVEIGLLPADVFGNVHVFAGVRDSAPLPDGFFEIVDIFNDLIKESKEVSVDNFIRILESRSGKEQYDNLFYLLNWFVSTGYLSQAEQLLIKVGQDEKFGSDGKWEELLFNFFILYSQNSKADVNRLNIMKLIVEQLASKGSNDIFLRIFARNGVDAQQLRKYFSEYYSDDELVEVFSSIINDYSDRLKELSGKYRDGNEFLMMFGDSGSKMLMDLNNALGILYTIIGDEGSAVSHYDQAAKLRKLQNNIGKYAWILDNNGADKVDRLKNAVELNLLRAILEEPGLGNLFDDKGKFHGADLNARIDPVNLAAKISLKHNTRTDLIVANLKYHIVERPPEVKIRTDLIVPELHNKVAIPLAAKIKSNSNRVKPVDHARVQFPWHIRLLLNPSIPRPIKLIIISLWNIANVVLKKLGSFGKNKDELDNDIASRQGKNLKKSEIDTAEVDQAIKDAIRNGRAISLDLAELSKYSDEELEESLKVFNKLDQIDAIIAVMSKYSVSGEHKSARRFLRRYLQSLNRTDIERLKENIRTAREAAIRHNQGTLLNRRLVILLTEDDAFSRGEVLAHAGAKYNSIYLHGNLLKEVRSEPDKDALGEILAHEDRDINRKGHEDDIDQSVFDGSIKPLWERIRAGNAGRETKREQADTVRNNISNLLTSFTLPAKIVKIAVLLVFIMSFIAGAVSGAAGLPIQNSNYSMPQYSNSTLHFKASPVDQVLREFTVMPENRLIPHDPGNPVGNSNSDEVNSTVNDGSNVSFVISQVLTILDGEGDAPFSADEINVTGAKEEIVKGEGQVHNLIIKQTGYTPEELLQLNDEDFKETLVKAVNSEKVLDDQHGILRYKFYFDANSSAPADYIYWHFYKTAGYSSSEIRSNNRLGLIMLYPHTFEKRIDPRADKMQLANALNVVFAIPELYRYADVNALPLDSDTKNRIQSGNASEQDIKTVNMAILSPYYQEIFGMDKGYFDRLNTVNDILDNHPKKVTQEMVDEMVRTAELQGGALPYLPYLSEILWKINVYRPDLKISSPPIKMFAVMHKNQYSIYPHIFEIVSDPYFLSKTDAMPDPNRFIFAVSVYRDLERQGLPADHSNIVTATNLLLKARQDFRTTEIFGPDTKIINIVNSDKYFAPYVAVMEEIERESNVKPESIHTFNVFKINRQLQQNDRNTTHIASGSDSNKNGMNKKKLNIISYWQREKPAALKAIAESQGPLVLWMSGHAEKGSFSLDDNNSITHQELAAALRERGDLQNVVIILDACYTYDLADNLLNELSHYGNEYPRAIITSVDTDKVGYVGLFANSLKLVHVPEYSLYGSDIHNAQFYAHVHSKNYIKGNPENDKIYADIRVLVNVTDTVSQNSAPQTDILPLPEGIVDASTLDSSRIAERVSRFLGLWEIVSESEKAGIRSFDERLAAPILELPRYLSLLSLYLANSDDYTAAVKAFYKDHGYEGDDTAFILGISKIMTEVVARTSDPFITVWGLNIPTLQTIALLISGHARLNKGAMKQSGGEVKGGKAGAAGTSASAGAVSVSAFSAVSIALQEFLQVVGLRLDDPSIDLATVIIERFTGSKGEDIVLTSETETDSIQVEDTLTLQNARDLNRRLREYSEAKETKVVVTRGDNTFVKYGNRIAGIPSFLHQARDGSLTLYIHQEFINALYAEKEKRAKEGMAALPRGDIVEQFVSEEVDELLKIRDLQKEEKLSPIQAYYKHHYRTADQRPAHHPLITLLAEKTGITILGLENVYQPTVIRPGSILLPGNEASVITQDTFKPRYFTDEMTRKVLSSFAELMDHVQFVFVDEGTGFTIEKHEPREIEGTIFENEGFERRKIKVTTTVTIAKEISFINMLNLAGRLYEDMLNESGESKGEQYKQLLENKQKEIEKIAKNFMYAADYLDSVKSVWPEELGIAGTAQGKELTEYLDTIIAGFRNLTDGYVVQETDTPEKQKAIAESWLGIDEGWWSVVKTEIEKEPANKRLNALKLWFAADENSWARNIAWELAAPARELDAAVMEKGGRLLDTIQGKWTLHDKILWTRRILFTTNKNRNRWIRTIWSSSQTLLQEIDIEMSGISPADPEYSERLMNVVQKRVSKYYDDSLAGKNTKSLSDDLKNLAKALGVDPSVLVSVNEISPSIIIESKHMACVMKSYLSGRILQQKGFSVYWLNIQETVGGKQEEHAAVLVKMPDGRYRIVDAAYPGGAGYIPEEYLTEGEVEQGLAGSMVYPKTLDTRSSSLHHAIRITAFEPGARSSVYNNLGSALLSQYRYAEAESAYRKTLEINPQNAGAWNNLGTALSSQKRYEEAEIAYREALEINPQNAGAWNNLGTALFSQKRYAEAESAYRKALEIDPQNADVWYNLGNTLSSQKRYAEAERAYRKTLKIDPRYANAWYSLGNAFYSQNRYSEAESAYRKALEINPQYADAWYNLASSLLRQNMAAAGQIAKSFYTRATQGETIDIEKALAEIDAAKAEVQGKNSTIRVPAQDILLVGLPFMGTPKEKISNGRTFRFLRYLRRHVPGAGKKTGGDTNRGQAGDVQHNSRDIGSAGTASISATEEKLQKNENKISDKGSDDAELQLKRDQLLRGLKQQDIFNKIPQYIDSLSDVVIVAVMTGMLVYYPSVYVFMLLTLVIAFSAISLWSFARNIFFDRNQLKVVHYNPFAAEQFNWSTFAVGIDGFWDIREVFRDRSSIFKNLVRIEVMLVPGTVLITLELLIDRIISKNIVRKKKELFFKALRSHAGFSPLKNMDVVFNRLAFVKDDNEERFVNFEMLAVQVREETGDIFEDTSENNIYNASEIEVFKLLKSMDVHRYQEIVDTVRNTNKVLYETARKDVNLVNPLIVFVIMKRKIYENGKAMGKIYAEWQPKDQALYDLIYKEYGVEGYVTYELLRIIDLSSSDPDKPFTEADLLGEESGETTRKLEKAGIIETKDNVHYTLNKDFRTKYAAKVAAAGGKITGDSLRPEEQRWAGNPAKSISEKIFQNRSQVKFVTGVIFAVTSAVTLVFFQGSIVTALLFFILPTVIIAMDLVFSRIGRKLQAEDQVQEEAKATTEGAWKHLTMQLYSQKEVLALLVMIPVDLAIFGFPILPAALFSTLVIPIVEEIISRKPLVALVEVTDNKWARLTATAFFAGLFAVAHIHAFGGNPLMIYSFFMAVYLGDRAMKFRSIMPTILLHSYVNSLGEFLGIDILSSTGIVLTLLGFAVFSDNVYPKVNTMLSRPLRYMRDGMAKARVQKNRGKDKTVQIAGSDPRMLAQAYDEGLISEGMINVAHIVRPADLSGAMENFKNADDIAHVWYTDLTKDAPADLRAVDLRVYVGPRLVNVWQTERNGATVYYVDLQGAGILNEETSSQLSQAAAQISSHFAGTDNVPGVREGFSLDMVVDHTDKPANVIAPFIGMNIMKPAFVPVTELTGRDLEGNPAIRRRLIRHAARQADLKGNKILKIDDINIDRRTGETIDPFEEFLRSLNVFQAAGAGQLQVDWSILQRARKEGRLTDKKLHEMLMLARYNSDDKRVPVHAAFKVTDRTTLAEIEKLYEQGFASVGLDLKDVSPDNARQLVEGLKDRELLYVVNAPAGSALADVPVMAKPEMVSGQAGRNIVVDAELPQNVDRNALVEYLEKLPQTGTIIFHHRDVKELVDAARDVTDQKALISFLNILVNLGSPKITNPEQAAQRGYNWPVKFLPVLDKAQLAALIRGDTDAAGLGVHSAIREQADEISDGKVRTAFLRAIAENMLVRDRLMLKQRELGEAFMKGTYRIEYDQMRLLIDLLTRESAMSKADLEKDQRDAEALQKEIDTAADDSLILGLRSSIANNKPRSGAVTVVIGLMLQDIIVDYNLRQAAKKKQEHFSTEGMRHLLAAA